MNVERKTLFRLGGAVVLVYLIIHYWDSGMGLLGAIFAAAIPLVFGFAAAYLLNILMSMYERWFFPSKQGPRFVRLRRMVCILLAFASFLAIVAGVVRLILPELISCLQLLAQEIPRTWARTFKWFEQNVDPAWWGQIEEFIGNTTWDWQAIMKKAGDFLVAGFGGVMGTMTSVLSSTFSSLITLLVGSILAIYMLSGKEKLLDQCGRVCRHYMKPKWYEKSRYVLGVMHNSFSRFIVGQCTEAVILGGLCMLGMMLLRLPYASMIGALVGFTALIPIAGAYIGAGIGAFMIFTVSPIQALVFLIFLVILQQLEGNVVYPRVVGASIGLPGIWVLTAITIGGALGGVGGMLLGVPLAATLYQVIRDDMGGTGLGMKKGAPVAPVEKTE